jgi:ATP-dependent DNA helicase RecG
MHYPGKESSTLEFKVALPKNNQIVKTVIGFCNHMGGKIILGVEDNGYIVGVEDEEVEYILDHLNQKIYEASFPPIIAQIYAQTIGEKTVLVIEVSAGMSKPYYLASEGPEKGTYVRVGRSTMLATPEMREELKLLSRGISFDSEPVYQANVDDLDMTKIEDFLTHRKSSAYIPSSLEDALTAYTLVTKVNAHTYPTVGGLLLFGKDPQKFFKEAFIICSRFVGNEGRETLATIDCLGTLVNQYQEAFNFLVSKLERSFTITGSVRKEYSEIPEVAIRETIINALMHRNYLMQSPIKIALYDNRLEVFSPGAFPGPISEENLLMGFTFIRNTVIAKVLREMGFSEKLGSGLKLIFDQYALRHLEAPKVFEVGTFVKYILPRPSMARVTAQTESDVHLLGLFEKVDKVSMHDIIDNLNISRSTALRRLSELIEKGHIKRVGKKRGIYYIRTR